MLTFLNVFLRSTVSTQSKMTYPHFIFNTIHFDTDLLFKSK